MTVREPRWRFLLLTLTLCAWMFLAPHLGDRLVVHGLLQLFLIHFVVVTLWANPRWGRMRQVLIGFWLLALLAAASTFVPMDAESHAVARVAHNTALIPLTVLLTTGLLRYVFARRQLDADGIFATIAAYLLVAFLFAQLYTIMATVAPASFDTPVPLSERSAPQVHADLLYYSLITLSTAGYGDILPATDIARTLAVIEATFGQFYLAIVVAVFVGMYSSAHQQR